MGLSVIKPQFLQQTTDTSSISYTIENAFYDFVENELSFDVYATITGDNIALGEGLLQIQYDTGFISSNAVDSGLVDVELGDSLSSIQYFFSSFDATHNAFRVDVLGGCPLPLEEFDERKSAERRLEILKITMHADNINFNDPIDFDEFFISENSKYVDTLGNCHDFLDVSADDDFVIETSENIGIEYLLDNFRYENVAGTFFLHFSLFAEQSGTAPSSNTIIEFEGGQVEVSYSDIAFGTSVVTNQKLTGTRAGFTDNLYNVVLSDGSTTSFIVEFNSPNGQKQMQSGQLYKMAEFTLEVASCLNRAGISGSIHSQMPNSFRLRTGNNIGLRMMYNPQTIVGEHDDFTCGNSNIIITKFNDNVPAGDNEKSKLTIQGAGFNNGVIGQKGKVYFPNADDGGTSFTYTHETDIEKWDDSEIILYVPSVIGDAAAEEKGTAGTGKFIIETPENNGIVRRTEDEVLTIPYSIMNSRKDNGESMRYTLTRNNDSPYNNEGYLWKVHDPLFQEDQNIIDCSADAFCQWNSACGIKNVVSMSTESTISVPRTGDNLHTISRGLPNSPSALAFTINRQNETSGCVVSNPGHYLDGRTLATVDEVDIYISETEFPNLDCVNDVNFQQTLLHEVGHAHTLGHIIPSGQLMYWTGGSSNIGTNETTGSLAAVSNSQELSSCSFNSIVTGTLTNCVVHNEEVISGSSPEFTLFPNVQPSSSHLSFGYTGLSPVRSEDIKILNNFGQTIECDITFTSKSLSIRSVDFEPGVYFLSVLSKGQHTTRKFILL